MSVPEYFTRCEAVLKRPAKRSNRDYIAACLTTREALAASMKEQNKKYSVFRLFSKDIRDKNYVKNEW